MVRYQSGDRAAFTLLVRRYERPIHCFVFRSTGSASTAQDLTQDVFVRVVHASAEFRHSSKFSTWIFSIARNLCIDHARRAKHRRHPSLDAPIGEVGDTSLGDSVADSAPEGQPHRAVVGARVLEVVERTLRELPEDLREVFLLREFGEVPFREIAEIVGAPENTVKSRMRYALERLQRALSEYEEHARTCE